MRLICLLAILVQFSSYAATVSIPDIDRANLDEISREFSANFIHTVVSHPKRLGENWGFEIGAFAVGTWTPNLNSLVRQVDPGNKVEIIPMGGGLFRMTMPHHLGFEATLFPRRTVNNVSLQYWSFAFQWDFGDLIEWKMKPLIPDTPFSLALKAHWGKSKLSFDQTINNQTTNNQNVDSTIGFHSSILGLQVISGIDLGWFNPYMAIGWAHSNTDADVNANGNANIFVNISSSKTQSSKNASFQYLAGMQFELFFINFALEYQALFGTKKVGAKLSASF